MNWRDIWASFIGRTPSTGWARPSDGGGRLIDGRLADLEARCAALQADLGRWRQAIDERDELRHLVRLCWAAWNDATLDDDLDERRHPLDLTDEQSRLLYETIEWTSLNRREGDDPPDDHAQHEDPPT